MGLTGLFQRGRLLDGWPLVDEVLDLAGDRLCQAERRRTCRTENGPFAEWACQECREFRRPETISPWTWHLVFLYQLKQAGYPFKANDLSLETWLMLRLVQKIFEATESKGLARETGPPFGNIAS